MKVQGQSSMFALFSQNPSIPLGLQPMREPPLLAWEVLLQSVNYQQNTIKQEEAKKK